MTKPVNDLPDFDSLGKKADEIYRSLGADFIEKNKGKYISIELDNGEYFVGDTREESLAAARKKHPTKLVFVRKVGMLEGISRHVKRPTAKV